GTTSQIGRLEVGFERQGQFGRPADHQMGLDRQALEQRQEAHPEDDARRPADADDQPLAVGALLHFTLFTLPSSPGRAGITYLDRPRRQALAPAAIRR